MCRKYVFCILRLILILQLFAMICLPNAAIAQSDEDTPGFWEIRTLILTVTALFIFASINYAINLFKKDKILKKLLKKYIVFEMKDGKRYRGTMRLESNGLEIISEESRQRGDAPSYIFRGAETAGIVAYIRYLDSMNERERLERDWDLDRVYHPRFPTRLRRKTRNFGIALKDSVNKTVEMVWGKIKSTAVFRPIRPITEVQEGEESEEGEEGEPTIDTVQKELWQYAMDESYERLIERLVGTRVKIKTHTGEYIAVLKEYNDKHIHLMDVKQTDGLGYEDAWKYTLDIANLNHRDDRGLRCRIEGNDLIFENNAPYDILLGALTFKEGSPDSGHDYKYSYRISAFSVQRLTLRPVPINHNIAPFERVAIQEQRTYKSFKKLHLTFRSLREADIVFPRGYCKIIKSAEKYQPELLDLGGLTEAILARKMKDIAIKDKDDKPIRGINVIHGYVTNINEDRIDLKAIDHSYGRRWSVEHAFHRLDDKLRKMGPAPVKILPPYRARIAAQAVLASEINESKSEQEMFAPLIYTPVVPRIKPYKKHELPFKVLALTGNTTQEEFPVLEQFERIRDRRIICEQVKDLRTHQIARTHLLWIGHGEIYKDGYRLNIDAEHRIKNFVSRGGIVVVSGQDISNMRGVHKYS